MASPCSPGTMLSITPAASAALASLLATPDVTDGAVVRLASEMDRSGEPAIGITIVTDVEAGDEVIESAAGPDVFVEPETADALDDQQLDVEVRDDRITFSLPRQSRNGGPPDAADGV
jgi:Fe-S cluster assembly iron-binding protein IscA